MEIILKYLITALLLGGFILTFYYFCIDTMVKIKTLYTHIYSIMKFDKGSRKDFTDSFRQFLKRNPVHIMGLIFLLLSVWWNAEIKKIIGNLETIYYILLLMLYYFIYMGCMFRKLVLNMGKIPVIVLVAIIMVFSLTPIYIDLLLQIQHYMDFGLVIISMLFCACLSFILAKTMLDKFKEKLSVLLVNSVFFWLFVAYTLMIFGTYDILMDNATNKVFSEGMSFTQAIMATIRYGAGIAANDISKAESFDKLFQGVIWALGTLIIANKAVITLTDTENKAKEQ